MRSLRRRYFNQIETFKITILFYQTTYFNIQNRMKRIINTSDAPAAIGPYSQAVEANGTLYISGQLPINPGVGKIEVTNIS